MKKKIAATIASTALLLALGASGVQAHAVYEWRYQRTYAGGYAWVRVPVPHTHPGVGYGR